jgi:DNA-binding transcriptional MerR regulator
MVKSPDAYRTISEASEELQVPQHVLRFWETKFSFLRPMKRAGGRRLYRPQDVVLLRGVQTLLYRDGYTIKGVQKLYKDQGVKRLLQAAGADEAAFDEPIAAPTPVPTGVNPEAPETQDAALNYLVTRLLLAKARLDGVLGR